MTMPLCSSDAALMPLSSTFSRRGTLTVRKVDLTDKLGLDVPLNVNRVIVQKDEQQMLVYYWFNHMGYTMPRNTAAKISVLTRGLVAGRRDGAILRLVSEIDHEDPNGEQKAEAEMKGCVLAQCLCVACRVLLVVRNRR